MAQRLAASLQAEERLGHHDQHAGHSEQNLRQDAQCGRNIGHRLGHRGRGHWVDVILAYVAPEVVLGVSAVYGAIPDTIATMARIHNTEATPITIISAIVGHTAARSRQFTSGCAS